MRRFATIRGSVRVISRAGALAAAFVVVGAGCQAITGSYTVGPSLGPVCSALLACCDVLPAGTSTMCLQAVMQQDENLCTAVRSTLGSCTPGASQDSGLHFPDATTQPEASTPANLNGTWTLTGVTCEGSNDPLNGTTTLTFATGSAEKVVTLPDGCTATLALTSVTITATDIEAAAGTAECSSSCLTSDCTPGSTGSVVLPYTLSAGVLTISQAVATTMCAGGTLLLNYSME